MPETELMITFRNQLNVKNFTLDGWFTSNVTALSKKFVVRTLNFKQNARDLQKISDGLQLQLADLSKSEKLSLIGGYQDSATSFEALFFVLDKAPRQAMKYYCRNLTCEQWGSDDM